MCLYGTLCWSGGWWGCWWSRTSCALLTACLPGTSSLGTSCLRREITRSYRFRLLALYFSDAFAMQDSSRFISMFRVWQRISESAAVMSDLYSSTVGDFRIFCCLVWCLIWMFSDVKLSMLHVVCQIQLSCQFVNSCTFCWNLVHWIFTWALAWKRMFLKSPTHPTANFRLAWFSLDMISRDPCHSPNTA